MHFKVKNTNRISREEFSIIFNSRHYFQVICTQTMNKPNKKSFLNWKTYPNK